MSDDFPADIDFINVGEVKSAEPKQNVRELIL
jgi:hypothetical protein